MGIFSLLFRKNDIITKDKNLETDFFETTTNKIDIVYQSGMLFKSSDSYVPDKDIMEIVVPTAINIFENDYTVYFTEKLLSKMLSDFNFNISLRKELRLISLGKSVNLESFKDIASKEVCFLDNLFIEKIAKDEINLSTYLKIRKVILESFKKAGETDPYFNEMYTIFSLRFLEYNNLDLIVKDFRNNLKNNLSIESENKDFKLYYIENPNTCIASNNIEDLINENLSLLIVRPYSFDNVSSILSKITEFLHKTIQEKLVEYDSNISCIDYIFNIKSSIQEVDSFLIDMIKHKKIDETIYLIMQDTLNKTFETCSKYDLYFECIYILYNNYISENKLFKEHITLKIHNIFNE